MGQVLYPLRSFFQCSNHLKRLELALHHADQADVSTISEKMELWKIFQRLDFPSPCCCLVLTNSTWVDKRWWYTQAARECRRGSRSSRA